MNRCPNCNGSIIRIGHKEQPFYCYSCNEWFSNEEVTPKQTNADCIRSMSDEKLAVYLEQRGSCPTTKKWEDCNELNPDTKQCEQCWLGWLKQEETE